MGVAAKMISPQNIAVACAASHLVGQEGALFRKTIFHSLGLLAIICVMTFLQAYYLKGTVPIEPAAISAAVTKSGAPRLAVSDLIVIALTLVALVALAYFNFVARPRPAASR